MPPSDRPGVPLFWQAFVGAAMLAVITVGLSAGILYDQLEDRIGGRIEAKLTLQLMGVARQAAARLDGDSLAAVYATGPGHPDYPRLQTTLREVQQEHQLQEDIYTLHRQGDATRFGVSCKDTPLHGQAYLLKTEMGSAFAGKGPSTTGVYQDDHGWWISAYAPVKNGQGQVVAIVEADHDLLPYIEETRSRVLTAVGISVMAGLLVALLLGMAYALRISRPIRNLAQLADKVSMGEVDGLEIRHGGPAEIRQLSEAFERVVVAVRYFKQLSEDPGDDASEPPPPPLPAPEGDAGA